MLIKFLGHSCFLLKSDDGSSILTDPYKSGAYGGALNYAPVTESVDIVILSHEHEDHAETKNLPNSPLMIRAGCRARGLEFDIIQTYHDDQQGEKRGPNRVTVFALDDIRVCHLGDLGHLLSPDQIEEIGEIDILLIPTGGTYTIDSKQATEVVEQLQPKIVIPMHFKTSRCAFPIEPVEAFLQNKSNVRRTQNSEVMIKKEDLPQQRTILCLEPAN